MELKTKNYVDTENDVVNLVISSKKLISETHKSRILVQLSQ